MKEQRKAQEKAKEKAKEKASTTWDSIAAPLNSNSNVFGKRMKAKIDEVHGTYSRSDEEVGKKEYEELKNLWGEIPLLSREMNASAPEYGTRVIKPSKGNPNWFPDEANFIQT